MRKYVWLIAITAGVLACSATKIDGDSGAKEPPQSRCIVAGYIPAYKIDPAQPGDLSYLGKPTRVYFFGIYPDAEGAWQLRAEIAPKLSVVRAAMSSSQELFVVAGGGASATPNMHVMGRDAAKREAYATALVEYAHRNNFDGIDMDWETDWSKSPAMYVAQEDFVDLMTRIRTKMNALPATTKVKKLSAALGSREDSREMAYAVRDIVDQVNVMIYDVYGSEAEGYPHAPLEMFQQRLEAFAARGIPKSKLLGGVPFYGGDRSKSVEATLDYKSICKAAGGKITPAMNRYDGYAFNGVDLIAAKSKYIVDNGYGGIMIWELAQDVAYSDPLSLLRSIKGVTDR